MDRRLALALTLALACAPAAAQSRGTAEPYPSAWERAHEEVRLAREALDRAEARRAAGPDVREGDRLGNANRKGTTRPSPDYLERMDRNDERVELAHRRLERAIEYRDTLR